MSIVEGACKECLPSQWAQKLPAGILVRRGTQDWEWGQQLKGGKRAFPSFELQTPGCTHRPLKNGDMEGFWSLSNSPWFPPQRTTQDSIPQMSLLPSTRHISNLGPPTSTTHKVSHWNLYGVQKNLLQIKRKVRRLGLLPGFWLTACERFHWAESSSCMVSKSGAINDS